MGHLKLVSVDVRFHYNDDIPLPGEGIKLASADKAILDQRGISII